MNTLKAFLLLLVLGLAGAAALIYSGFYNVAADAPHWSATYELLELARQRSIEARSADIQPPDLSDPELIRGGAGNYDAMCVGCHLRPGGTETELSLGLYPSPPRWDALGRVDPRAAFWVVKHGIKASGMPAWGKSMDDRYLWGMVAFMQTFPGMTPAEYRAQVEASPGHSHGGGETDLGGETPHAMPPASATKRSSFEPVKGPTAERALEDQHRHEEHKEHDDHHDH